MRARKGGAKGVQKRLVPLLILAAMLAALSLAPPAASHPAGWKSDLTGDAFSFPRGVAFEPTTAGEGSSRIFVAETNTTGQGPENDPGVDPVVKAIGQGSIETIAGVGSAKNQNTPHIAHGEKAKQSYLPSLLSIQFDAEGNLYLLLTDTVYKLGRETGSNGITGDESAVKVVGAATGVESDSGVHPTEAYIHGAAAIAFDAFGGMFIAHRHRIIRVDPGTTPGFNGLDGDGMFNDPTETFTRVAGIGRNAAGFTGDGVPASSSGLAHPMGISFDRSGNLLIADTCNHRIRKVFALDGKVLGTPDEIITTVAGRGAGSSFLDGLHGCPPGQDINYKGGGFNENETAGIHPLAINADLDMPRSVVEDAAGNLIVADSRNNRIRKIHSGADGQVNGNDPSEVIDTIAGCGPVRKTFDSAVPAECDDTTQEALSMPYGFALPPCPHPNRDVLVTEWAAGGRVLRFSGVASCTGVDLSMLSFVADQAEATVGRPVGLTVIAKNKGPEAAKGVKIRVSNDQPLLASFGSDASIDKPGRCQSNAGTEIVCELHAPLGSGDQVTLRFSATPIAPGNWAGTASIPIGDVTPPEQAAGDETDSLSLPIKLAAVTLPPLPELNLPPAANDSPPPPPPGSGPPSSAPVDPGQTTITIAPPGGTGSAAPSTAPAPGPASQPSFGRVPLTGSLGFQPGLQTSAAAAASPSATTSAMPAAAVSAMSSGAFEPDEESEPAPRYSMVAYQAAAFSGLGLSMLLGLFCLMSSRGSGNPSLAYGWTSSGSRGATARPRV